MMPSLTTWIALPLVGGLIGYLTNRLAVKMIFRPIKPRRFLGIKIQGLMGRRQKELAKSIGNVVGNHLVLHEDLVKSFDHLNFADLLEDVLGDAMNAKVKALQALPLIGGFLTDERVAEIKKSLVDGILDHEDQIKARLESAVEEGVDIGAMVEQKVSEFPVEKLEKLVLKVASKELRAIEILGGLLGLIIGVGQVGLLWWLG